jgi:hypothetical protein
MSAPHQREGIVSAHLSTLIGLKPASLLPESGLVLKHAMPAEPALRPKAHLEAAAAVSKFISKSLLGRFTIIKCTIDMEPSRVQTTDWLIGCFLLLLQCSH